VPARSRLAQRWRQILRYERNVPIGEWQRRVIVVVDGDSPSSLADGQAFLDALGDGFEARLIEAKGDAAGARAEVLEALSGGSLLLAYFGHGSIDRWGREGVVRTDDLGDVSDGARLPVALHMTCLTGLFTHPTKVSLAEGMVLGRRSGAVAAFAPTSLTLPGDQMYLERGFAGALAASRAATLGELVLASWRATPVDSPGPLEAMLTFNLIGDPGLRLPVALEHSSAGSRD